MPFPAFLLIACAISGGLAYVLLFVRPPAAVAGALIVAAALAIVTIDALAHVRYYSDDAFITLRYSRNLSDGVGPVWNPGERVEGYTNFSWMALLAGMHRAGFELVFASRVLAGVSLAATFGAMWGLWRTWAPDAEGAMAHPALPAAAMIAVALSAPFSAWGYAGLETPLAAALLTAGAWRVIAERRAGGLPASALIFAAGGMTRPELALIGAATAAWLLVDAARSGDRAGLRRAVAWAAIFAAAYGTYFAWRWSYYGYPLPNTFYAKVGSSRDFISRGLSYVEDQGMPLLFLPFAAGMLALLFHPSQWLRRDAAYVTGVVAAWLAIVAVEGGDAFPWGRLLAPATPLLYLAGAAGAAFVLERALPERRQFAAAAGAVCVLVGLALAQSAVDPLRFFERDFAEQRRDAAELLRARLPHEYTVGVIAAGATPYYSELPSLDLLGLTDETIAHSERKAALAATGHEKYDLGYTLEVARPEVILLGGYGGTVQDRQYVTDHPPPLPVPVVFALVADARTWERYQMSAWRDGARWFSFLQRKDTLDEVPPDWTEGEPKP